MASFFLKIIGSMIVLAGVIHAATERFSGRILTIEVNAAVIEAPGTFTNATICQENQNHYYVNVDNNWFWGDYSDAGKAMLSFLLTMKSTGVEIDLVSSSSSIICGAKRIDRVSTK